MKLPFGKVPARSNLHNVTDEIGMISRTCCSFNILRGADLSELFDSDMVWDSNKDDCIARRRIAESLSRFQ